MVVWSWSKSRLGRSYRQWHEVLWYAPVQIDATATAACARLSFGRFIEKQPVAPVYIALTAIKFDLLSGRIQQKIPRFSVYPSSHYVTPREIKRLEKLMMEHARNLEFEKAAGVRDQLAILKEQAFGAAGSDNLAVLVSAAA